ncbi:glutaredoxin domain-containing protein [Pseudobutyrivibrio xylanivorans]|uniref:Glutaredoxin n=1 Tax=Pseudobutyrivibrio xylanivorans TaxID=185007 RepID=A0A5P6VTM2_PSEXY|nr:glutaredoxin domain-containing protein [Pseudobutyrivibrio xylanivorans]QFJ54231.1 glutaredoxin [Pseudobutyrivibrio xylanivorans]
MIKVYGSSLCPDCINFEYNLTKNNIEYEYIDIHKNMANLKAFLRLRDTNQAFDNTKANGYVGIPAIVYEDLSVTLDWEKYLVDKGITVIYLDNETSSNCGIDGKGC